MHLLYVCNYAHMYVCMYICTYPLKVGLLEENFSLVLYKRAFTRHTSIRKSLISNKTNKSYLGRKKVLLKMKESDL